MNYVDMWHKFIGRHLIFVDESKTHARCNLTRLLFTIHYMNHNLRAHINEYYVAYKPIILLCILFMFIDMKFIYYYLIMMFIMNSMRRI